MSDEAMSKQLCEWLQWALFMLAQPQRFSSLCLSRPACVFLVRGFFVDPCVLHHGPKGEQQQLVLQVVQETVCHHTESFGECTCCQRSSQAKDSLQQWMPAMCKLPVPHWAVQVNVQSSVAGDISRWGEAQRLHGWFGALLRAAPPGETADFIRPGSHTHTHTATNTYRS